MITVFMNNKGVGGGREPFQSITNFTPHLSKKLEAYLSMFCSPIHLLIMSKQVMISENKLFTHIHVLLINFLIIHLLVSHRELTWSHREKCA
jgi:hypothetical protein